MAFSLSLRRSVGRSTSTSLLAGEQEQLSVDGKQVGDGILEAAARIDRRADRVDPVRGHGRDMLLAVDHEGERVEWMAHPLSTMAAWFAATPMGEHQGAREGVGGNAEAGQKGAAYAVSRQRPRPQREDRDPLSDSNNTIRTETKQGPPPMFQPDLCALPISTLRC